MIKLDDDEQEAGNVLKAADYSYPTEQETAMPGMTMPNPPANTFDPIKERDELFSLLRKPRDYQPEIDREKKNKRYQTAVAAFSLLANLGKGLAGGTIRREDYPNIGAAEQGIRGYEGLAQRDTERYDTERGNVLRDIYNRRRQREEAAAKEQQGWQRMLLKNQMDREMLKERDKTTQGQIAVRGDLAKEMEGIKQGNREDIAKKRFGFQSALVAQRGRTQQALKLFASDLKKDEPFIRVANPNGSGAVDLNKAEAASFLGGIIDEVNADDVEKAIKSPTAAQLMVSKYANKNPEALTQFINEQKKGKSGSSGKTPRSAQKGVTTRKKPRSAL